MKMKNHNGSDNRTVSKTIEDKKKQKTNKTTRIRTLKRQQTS